VEPGPAKEGRDQVNAVHGFIATLGSDPVMRERVLYVFSVLPEDVQEEFMGDRLRGVDSLPSRGR
jgi:hypothetical protein